MASAAADEEDLYALLCCEKTASQRELRASYLRISSALHPDKSAPHMRQISNEHFKRVDYAYRVLSDPAQRHIYDTLGAVGVAEYNTFANSIVGRELSTLRTPAQALAVLERMIREKNELALNSKSGGSGHFKVDMALTQGGLDVTQYIMNQSVSSRLSEKTYITYGGYVLSNKGKGLASVVSALSACENCAHSYALQGIPVADLLFTCLVLVSLQMLAVQQQITEQHTVTSSLSLGHSPSVSFSTNSTLASDPGASYNSDWVLGTGDDTGVKLSTNRALRPGCVGDLSYMLSGREQGVAFKLTQKYRQKFTFVGYISVDPEQKLVLRGGCTYRASPEYILDAGLKMHTRTGVEASTYATRVLTPLVAIKVCIYTRHVLAI
jgi:hypothetical protein